MVATGRGAGILCGVVGVVALLTVVAAAPATAAGASTSMISVPFSPAPVPAPRDGDSGQASVSADGNLVAFSSESANLVPDDTNGHGDVFLRDRRAGVTTLISLTSTGGPITSGSDHPAISPDGRFVAFTSDADNVLPGGTIGKIDVYVRDLAARTTSRVSVPITGRVGNDSSAGASLSSGGRYVAFSSLATNLVTGDTNGHADVFVRDRTLNVTRRISVAPNGAESDGDSGAGSISADGRYVTFTSAATNLVAGDTNGRYDVFVRDLTTNVTRRVSTAIGGAQANADSVRPRLSADGRFVTFESRASNLVAGDTNGLSDVFVRDLGASLTRRVSVGIGGAVSNGDSFQASVSADGRYVAFASAASNLAKPVAAPGQVDVYLRDLATGITIRSSVRSAGGLGNGFCDEPAVSVGGSVVFTSSSTNLSPLDTDHSADVFVRDLGGT